MKKYIFALFAFLLCPIFLFSGCGAVAIEFERTTSNIESIFNFYTSMISTQNKYKTLIESYDNTELSQEENSAMNLYLQEYETFNNKLYMALPGLDSAIDDSTLSCYDLSKVNSSLSSFNLYQKSTNKYILKISGMGDNSYLPIVSLQNTSTVTDLADDIILSMGNAIQYEVSYSSMLKSWTVVVSKIFYYPSEQDVPNSEENGIKIVRNNGAQSITIVYTNNSQTYSKKITFGATAKNVEKFTGDITQTTSTSTGNYNYVIADANFLGRYEFKYDPSTSYFYGKHTKTSDSYSLLECYNLKKDIFIARLNIVKTGDLNQSIEFMIGGDNTSGKIKSKKFAGNLPYMSDFSSITKNTFATLTLEEKTQTNKIYAFTISNGKTTCENVGY